MAIELEKLDIFTKAFFEAIFFVLETDEDLNNVTIFDFDQDTFDLISQECQEFQEKHDTLIADDLSHAGYDFYFTREGHGVGFWDGDWTEPAGDILTKASHQYGEMELYVGDSGHIYRMNTPSNSAKV